MLNRDDNLIFHLSDFEKADYGQIQVNSVCKIDSSKFNFKGTQIKEINEIEVKGKLTYKKSLEILYCDLSITAKMIVYCSLSNEEINYKLIVPYSEAFSFDGEKAELYQVDFLKEKTFELTNSVVNFTIANIPTKIVKPGIKLNKQGTGWEILSETDLAQRSDPFHSNLDPRWDKLEIMKREMEEKDRNSESNTTDNFERKSDYKNKHYKK